MGILSLLPPELITFLTWLVLFVAASAVILILAIGLSKLFGDLSDRIFGMFR